MFKKIVATMDGSAESERIAGWAAELARGLKAELTLLSVVDADHLPETARVDEGRPRETSAGAGPTDAPGGYYRDRTMTGGMMGGAWMVIPPPGGADYRGDRAPGASQAELVDDVMAEINTYLAAQREKLEEYGITVSQEVTVGEPAEEIPNAAARLGADMIAMVTNRSSRLSRAVQGSVTDEVAHRTAMPVLIVNVDADDEPFEDSAGRPGPIVVPVDMSDASENAIPQAAAIAKALDARLLLVHVAEDAGNAGVIIRPREGTDMAGIEPDARDAVEYLERQVNALVDQGVSAEGYIASGDPSDAIIELMRDTAGSMAVMASSGKRGLERWFAGSVTDEVVRRSHRPVLVLSPGNP
ncbi:MAG: universal stress protein [Dehalococcoidia bacterium]